MSTNSEVAELFRAIADLLDLKGERFKPEAYRRAARSIENLGDDLREVAKRDELDQIPGVGEALREKTLEYLKDGRIPYYERLRAEFPPGVLELMRIPGIGPKTTGRLFLELHVDSPAALRAAIDEGRLVGLAGFGARKIEKLRQALDSAGAGDATRAALRVAWELARSIVRELSATSPVASIEVAGSLRRRRDSVGDLDILATAAHPRATIEAFAALPGVLEVVLKGDTKVTVRYAPGIQVDLRVVDPASLGAALQYFTGSKDHNVHLRTIARDRGLKINEYGVFRGDERVAGRTEEDVYRVLDMPWIPPEIRENQGEIEAAARGQLPRLIDLPDLRGELHRHALEADGASELARDAARLHLDYVGLVLRASDPSSVPRDRVAALRDGWHSAAGPGPRLLIGLECPLATLAASDHVPDGVDYTIGTFPRGGAPLPTGPIAHPPLFLAHPSPGAGDGVSPGAGRADWFEWCRTRGVGLEVTPDPPSDGFDSGEVRRALAGGCSFAVSAGRPDSPSLDALELAVGVARRGWAPPESVINASPSPAPRAGPSGSRGAHHTRGRPKG